MLVLPDDVISNTTKIKLLKKKKKCERFSQYAIFVGSGGTFQNLFGFNLAVLEHFPHFAGD